MNRTFVIGDIHGCFDELLELLEKVGADSEDVILSVGDIVDRGNKSAEVYRYFRDTPNAVVLIGNHERKHLNGVLSYAQEIVKVQMGYQYDEFKKWLEGLRYYFENGDAIIVHAAFENEVSIFQQRRDVLSGSTSGERYLEKILPENTYWSDHYTGKKPIIYGHHVVGNTPKIINNTFGIDTGACHGGYLTAIELPGFQVHQVKAKKDYWKEQQENWQIPVLKAKSWDNMTFDAITAQIEKLGYIENSEVRAYLDEMTTWSRRLQDDIVMLKGKIDALTERILLEENFNQAAAKYSFSRFLFMSRGNKLTIEELKKVINTPQKLKDILDELAGIA